jgi:hypothetical protein
LGLGYRTSRFPFREARLELLDHLLVRFSELGGFARSRLSLTFDIAHNVEEDFDRAKIGGGRAVGELSDNRFTLADLATPAILRDENALIERLIEERREILGPDGRPRGLPDRPFTKRVARGGLP